MESITKLEQPCLPAANAAVANVTAADVVAAADDDTATVNATTIVAATNDDE